jgi:hypothetical protein
MEYIYFNLMALSVDQDISLKVPGRFITNNCLYVVNCSNTYFLIQHSSHLQNKNAISIFLENEATLKIFCVFFCNTQVP